MRWKKRLLNNARLYLILDRGVNEDEELLGIVRISMEGGVDLLQLRDKCGTAMDTLKCAERILRLTKGQIPLIINDRLDVALACGADGVHLGQEDLPLKRARGIIGEKAIIGVSCQTLAQAKRAEKEGADYIGFGSVFKTPTKPERDPMDLQLLAKVIADIKIPVFAIGGISLGNVDRLRALGVHRVAVCRAICKAHNMREMIEAFVKRNIRVRRRFGFFCGRSSVAEPQLPKLVT